MSNMHPGDKVSPLEAGRLLKEQAARIARRSGKTADEASPIAGGQTPTSWSPC